jgi:hypothetical protein
MLIGFSYLVDFAGHWHWFWEVIFFAFMGKLVAMTMMFMSMLISKICSFSYFVDTLMVWLGIIQFLFILLLFVLYIFTDYVDVTFTNTERYPTLIKTIFVVFGITLSIDVLGSFSTFAEDYRKNKIYF